MTTPELPADHDAFFAWNRMYTALSDATDYLEGTDTLPRGYSEIPLSPLESRMLANGLAGHPVLSAVEPGYKRRIRRISDDPSSCATLFRAYDEKAKAWITGFYFGTKDEPILVGGMAHRDNETIFRLFSPGNMIYKKDTPSLISELDVLVSLQQITENRRRLATTLGYED